MRYLISLFLCFTTTLHAQDTISLTLPFCIRRALVSSLDIQDSKLSVELASINLKSAYWNFFPSITASVDYRRNFGTSFDMFTFQRVNVATSFSSPTISASLPLFQGGLLRYQYKQQKHLYFSSKKQLKAQELNTLLNLLDLFTRLQNDMLQLQLNEEKIALLREQIEQKKVQAQNGLIRYSEVVQLEAQLATEKGNWNQLQNQYQQDLLQLLFMLRLKPGKYYTIEPFEVDTSWIERSLPPIDQIVDSVFKLHPQLAFAEEQLRSEEYQVKVAKSQLFPQLVLTGAIGSNYSSNGGQVEFNPVTGEVIRTRTSWGEQMQDNFYQSISIRLNVPIFDRYQARLNLAKATVNYEKQLIQYEKSKQQLIQVIYQTYYEIKALQSSIRGRKKQLEASKLSYEEAKVLYEGGKLNFVDYQTSLNQFQTAQLQYQTELQLLQLAWWKLLLLQGQKFPL